MSSIGTVPCANGASPNDKPLVRCTIVSVCAMLFGSVLVTPCCANCANSVNEPFGSKSRLPDRTVTGETPTKEIVPEKESDGCPPFVPKNPEGRGGGMIIAADTGTVAKKPNPG